MRGGSLRALLLSSMGFVLACCQVTTFCEFYEQACEDRTVNVTEDGLPCSLQRNNTQNCILSFPDEEPTKLACIHAVTTKDGSSVKYSRCFVSEETCSFNSCILQDGPNLNESPSIRVRHCCCRGNFCNKNIDYSTSSPQHTSVYPTNTRASSQGPTPVPNITSRQRTTIIIAVATCGSILVLTFLIILPVWYWCVCHRTLDSAEDCEDNEISQCRSYSIELLNAPGADQSDALRLEEKIGIGRFAEVWRAKFLTEDVAVKIFYEGERSSWVSEVNTYIKPVTLRHESLLRFWFAEKRPGDIGPEFWLVTDYHSNGSLCDFLKEQVIDLEDLCAMAASLAAGMTYLHSRIVTNGRVKPVIAHRDIKSRNVLIKTDKTCCISDFGLAIKFKHGQKVTEAHGQVGTIRYMAPEVLEGAISFQEQSFLRTDIYAVALVLWEMVNRCVIAKEGVRPYQQPYEAEVGSHPTVEKMLEVVVVRKVRPSFGSEWNNREPLETIRETIEECWDCEAEARLTAHLIEERLKQCRLHLAHFNQPCVVSLPTNVGARNTTNGRLPNATVTRANGLPNGADVSWSRPNEHVSPSGTHSFFHHTNQLCNGLVSQQNGIIERLNPTKTNNIQLFSPSRRMFHLPPTEASSSSCPPPYSPVADSADFELSLLNSKDSSIGSNGETSV